MIHDIKVTVKVGAKTKEEASNIVHQAVSDYYKHYPSSMIEQFEIEGRN